MKRILYILSLGGVAFCWLACSDEGPGTDPCEENAPLINAIEVSNAGCSDGTGSLLIQAGGGNGSLSYSLNGTDFQPENSFHQLAEGNYTVTVRDEQRCQATEETTVGVESDMSLAISSLNASGCDTAEGAVKLQAQGGNGAYTYSVDGTTFQEEDEFDQLPAGSHTFYVKDGTGCEISQEFEVRTGISFDASVKSIIETNCAVSGCHVAGTGRANFTQFSAIRDNASTIKSYTQNGIMPPAGSGHTLTDDEIQEIACWIEDGTPQN